MKEYIEREAARDLMERALEDDWEIQYADDRLDEIPAADVVEVVRCRDCRYFYNGFMKCCTNHFGVVLTDENGFCHHAKRREDEGGNTRWVESNTYITPQQKKM